MLLTLLFHRTLRRKERYASSPFLMEKNLQYLKQFPSLFPGEKHSLHKMQVCITFDDAYFDFYHYVFPLLKKYQIKAVLGVPCKYILDDTSCSLETRLSVKQQDALLEYEKSAPFCTWQEIQEMERSGLVEIASHSYSHPNLLSKNVEWGREIIGSKKFLEEKLAKEVNTFIYPMGKFNRNLHRIVAHYYKYVMRIGSSLNVSWKNSARIHYRIPADGESLPKIFQKWPLYSLQFLKHQCKRR